jgi:hypothetical protein
LEEEERGICVSSFFIFKMAHTLTPRLGLRSKINDPWFKTVAPSVVNSETSVRSASPAGEHRGGWRSLWMKKGSVVEEEEKEDMDEDCEKCDEERKEYMD